jgi:hypothetical protein
VLAPVGLGVSLSGCATSSAEPPPSYQTSLQAPRGAIEDDGLPAQTAPPARIRQLPDDPSEPFSPNYGPQPPRRLSQAEAEAVIARAITAHEMRKP